MINMFNVDCMEFMAGKPDKHYDLAIVDPPYGIGEHSERRNKPTNKWANPVCRGYKLFDDSKPPSKDYFEELFRVSKNQIIWGANNFTEFLPPSTGWIVWNKKAGIKEYLSMAELAFSSFNVRCKMFDFMWVGFRKQVQEHRIHPTQKPVALYEWLLRNYATPGDRILDTHGGSMSSAIACHNLDFSLDICEIDADYFEQAKARFENHCKQVRLTDLI